MIETDFKEQVRAQISFPDLVAETVQLRNSPNGRRAVMALCPFHPDKATPSLAVYEDHATCYGACKQTWDLYGWIMQRDGVEFPEALRTAADRAGLTPPEWTPQQQQRAARARQQQDVLTVAYDYYRMRFIQSRDAKLYAAERGLSPATIEAAGLGYADRSLPSFLSWMHTHEISQQQALDAGLLGRSEEGRIYLRFRDRLVVPFLRGGRTVFFTARDLSGSPRVPKWLHLPIEEGVYRPLYGGIGGKSALILVESPLCALSLRQIGREATALLGTTLPDGLAHALRRHAPLFLMLDGDEAGRRAADAIAAQIGPRVRIAALPDGDDINAMLVRLGQEEMAQRVDVILRHAPTYVEHLAAQVGHGDDPLADGDLIDRLFRAVNQLDERDMILIRKRLVELSGLGVRQFNELARHVGRQAVEEADWSPSLDGRYGIVSGVICALGGGSPTPLCNFSAGIERMIRLDDGESVRTEYVVRGASADGRRFSAAQVPTDEFAELKWLDRHWGVSAVVAHNARGQFCEAVKLLSQGAPAEHVYTHTGWREVDGQRVYLHCGGAVGYQGAEDGQIEVDLGPELGRYQLPPRPEDPAAAFAASLRFQEIAAPAVALPLWAAMYHAPLLELLPARSVLWAYGPTNVMKSTLMLLAMRHFGPFAVEGDAVGWSSTANALELMAFRTKDAPLLIDDFAHQPYHYQQKRMQQAAERIIRSCGNETGRARMTKNTTLRATYRVRSLILVTGETLPAVAPSAHSRILPLRFQPATVDLARLTVAQEMEAELYSHAMSGYLLWLRDNWARLAQELPEQHRQRRAEQSGERTARLTDVIVRNWLAGQTALAYGRAIRAISEPEAQAIGAAHWDTLVEIAETQDREVKSENPVLRYLGLLLDLLDAERAWLQPVAMDDEDVPHIKPVGAEKVGWQTADHYWLIPEASWGLIQRQAASTGQPLTFSAREIQERLYEAGILIKDRPPRWKSRLQRVSGRPWCLKLDTHQIFASLGD